MQFYRISVVLLLNIVIFSQDLEDLSREVSDLQEEPPIIPTQSDLFNK